MTTQTPPVATPQATPVPLMSAAEESAYAHTMNRLGEPGAPTVLVVEDDDGIGRHLTLGLQSNGYQPTWCRTGRAGLAEARRAPYDVVLLDLGLPDIDGVDVARLLRVEQPDLLIVILTARSDDIDVVAGLDAGADDYLVKPFNLTVLLARVRAHLRRRPTSALVPTEPILIGDLRIDLVARRCHLGSREVTLRTKEFELLAALASQPGRAVARESLMASVWDENWFGSTKTLDVTMAALRRRLNDASEAAGAGAPVRVPTITTLRGHGYRLEPPATE